MKMIVAGPVAVIACGLTLFGGPAVAQDATRDWSGAYAGFTLSANDTAIEITDVDNVSPALVDFSASGTAAGALIGYNVQRGSLVYGVELSFAAGGAAGARVIDTIFLDETLNYDVQNEAALKARVGSVFGRTLVYGIAGVTKSRATYGYVNLDDSFTVVEDDNRVTDIFSGYVIGMGVEHAITDALSLRGDVQQSVYAEKTLAIVPETGSVPLVYSPSNTAVSATIVLHF